MILGEIRIIESIVENWNPSKVWDELSIGFVCVQTGVEQIERLNENAENALAFHLRSIPTVFPNLSKLRQRIHVG